MLVGPPFGPRNLPQHSLNALGMPETNTQLGGLFLDEPGNVPGRNRPVVLSALGTKVVTRVPDSFRNVHARGLTATVRLEVWAVTWSATLAPSHGDDARSHPRPAH